MRELGCGGVCGLGDCMGGVVCRVGAGRGIGRGDSRKADTSRAFRLLVLETVNLRLLSHSHCFAGLETSVSPRKASLFCNQSKIIIYLVPSLPLSFHPHFQYLLLVPHLFTCSLFKIFVLLFSLHLFFWFRFFASANIFKLH
jgi:hypothetical protein